MKKISRHVFLSEEFPFQTVLLLRTHKSMEIHKGCWRELTWRHTVQTAQENVSDQHKRVDTTVPLGEQAWTHLSKHSCQPQVSDSLRSGLFRELFCLWRISKKCYVCSECSGTAIPSSPSKGLHRGCCPSDATALYKVAEFINESKSRHFG